MDESTNPLFLMSDEKQYLRTRIPKTLHRDFKMLCVAEGKTMEDIVAELIKRWVDERKNINRS